MIFVTGDTHGTSHYFKDSAKLFDKTLPKELKTAGNYLIITGDFGFVWDGKTCKQNIAALSANFSSTILFIDGNNDNIDILNSLPVFLWHGGKVHMLAPNIIHLMRGEIYEIEGKKILALGGADSYDRPLDKSSNEEREFVYKYRESGVNWWPGERLSKKDLDNAITNLKRYNNKVDFIITHDVPTSVLNKHFDWNVPAPTNERLETIYKLADYRQWFAGHHHCDRYVDSCMQVKFNEFENLDNPKYEKFHSEYDKTNTDVIDYEL